MMKRIHLPIGLFVLLALQPTWLFSQTNAREVLDQAIEALGGSAYLDVEDVQLTGRFFQFQRGELVGGDLFTDYLKFPDKERTEFGKDRETVRINNGTRGWNISDEEVTAQLGEQIELFWEEFRVSLDYLLRVVVSQPDTTLQYIGRDMIDFRRVDILELRDEDRTRINFYVDRADHLLVKKTVRRLDSPAVHEEIYSNYHQIQGVLTPLFVHRYTDGLKTMEIRFEEVVYNSGLGEELFTAEVKP